MHAAYTTVSGTSFAAPLVAAVAALMRFEFPSLSAAAVKNILIGSCDAVRGANLHKVAACGGRLNAAEAMRKAAVLAASAHSLPLSEKPEFTFRPHTRHTLASTWGQEEAAGEGEGNA